MLASYIAIYGESPLLLVCKKALTDIICFSHSTQFYILTDYVIAWDNLADLSSINLKSSMWSMRMQQV